MRMPILAYFVVVGTALLALLVLSNYELPDVGSPIITSQRMGLPKVVMRPDNAPIATASFNFAAPEKESRAVQSLNGIHAEQISEHKQKTVHPVKRRQAEINGKSAARQPRVALYSHDVQVTIH